jgi:phosphotransferase system HPr (HPr) family protein
MSTQAELVVSNPSGLHARPAAKFVELARTFEAELTIHLNGSTANGKSLLSLLRLGVTSGSEIVIQADGPDEHEATEALSQLLARLAEGE